MAALCMRQTNLVRSLYPSMSQRFLSCSAKRSSVEDEDKWYAEHGLMTVNNALLEAEGRGSSEVSPLPKTATSLNALAGVPEEQLRDRKATIFLPTRSAMTSGSHNMRKWQIKFDNKARWENPLMGWASSGDPLSNTVLEFGTRESAAAWCDSHGWKYEIKEPTLPTRRPKSYAQNFSWDKRTRTSSK